MPLAAVGDPLLQRGARGLPAGQIAAPQLLRQGRQRQPGIADKTERRRDPRGRS